MKLTKVQKKKIYEAADQIASGAWFHSCTAIHCAGGMELRSRYCNFYDQSFYGYWPKMACGPAGINHRLMLMLWFAEVGDLD